MRALHLAPFAAAAALLAAGCGSTGHQAAGGDVGLGKALFQQKCAGCHTLADANAKGAVGPNLDDALGDPQQQGFKESTVRDVVRGQIAYASPPMPQNLVTGAQAEAVAAYVAQVAGKPVQGTGVKASPLPGSTSSTTAATSTTPAPSGGEAALAAGKKVFADAGCSGCHTLKDAGATGTTGPNLDQLKPPKARVAKQVTNGGKIMPAFKGSLSQQQIDDVATYVSSVAGK